VRVCVCVRYACEQYVCVRVVASVTALCAAAAAAAEIIATQCNAAADGAARPREEFSSSSLCDNIIIIVDDGRRRVARQTILPARLRAIGTTRGATSPSTALTIFSFTILLCKICNNIMFSLFL